MNTPNLIREALSTLDCDYAFYYQPRGGEPLLVKNDEAGLLDETRPRD